MFVAHPEPTKRGMNRATRAEFPGILTSSRIVPVRACVTTGASQHQGLLLSWSVSSQRTEKGAVPSIITFPMMLPTSCREKKITDDDVTRYSGADAFKKQWVY